MGPLIGAALRVGAKEIAKKFGTQAAVEGAETGARKAGQSIVSQAVRNAEANKTNVTDEIVKLESRLATKNELATAQANPARQKAVDEATTSVKEGVKTTEYPYVKPTAENMKRGGSIRGGGCETKGKTKGRFV